MNYKQTPIQPFGVLIEPTRANLAVKDVAIPALRNLFQDHQLVVLRGFNAFNSANHFAKYCESWGEISIWPFGKVLNLIEQENPKDHIFDSSYIPLHWDGMYRPQVPEYQIFHCVQAPYSGQGGRTTFSNTILTLKNAASESTAMWNRVTGTYQRKMEFYHSKTVTRIIKKHPFRDFAVIRYNEPPSKNKGPFVNPPQLEFIGVDEIDVFHNDLQQALYDPRNFYAHAWQKGDVLIADNFSLLHGRESFVSKSPRHLQRVHVLSNPPLDNPDLAFYK